MVDSIDILTSISTISVAINLLTSFTTLRASLSSGIFQIPLIIFSIILIVCIAVQSIAYKYKKNDSSED